MGQNESHELADGLPGPDALKSALERICFLEWRNEQLESVLEDERELSLRQKRLLAELESEKLDAVDKLRHLEARLAEAMRDAATQSERVTRSEAVRNSLEHEMANLGERTAKENADLCRKLLAGEERSRGLERALDESRERVALLERGRDRLFQKLLEWQQAVREQREDDVDLAEFIADLRAEVLALSSENDQARAREKALTEALRAVGVDHPPGYGSTVPPARTQSKLGSSRPASPAGEKLSSRPPAVNAETQAPAILSSAMPSAAVQTSEVHHAATPDAEVAPPSTEPSKKSNLPKSAALLSDDDVRGHLDLVGSSSRRKQAMNLLPELFSDRKSIRLIAARSLLIAAEQHAAAALVKAFHAATDQEERVQLLGLVGETRARGARRTLEGALADPSPEIRIAALSAGLRLLADDPEALGELVRLSLSDRDPKVRRRAILAVVAAPKISVDEVLAPLLSDADPQTRRMACSALSRGSPTAAVLRSMVQLLLDPERTVRVALADAVRLLFGRDIGAQVDAPEESRRRVVLDLKRRLSEASSEAHGLRLAGEPGRHGAVAPS